MKSPIPLLTFITSNFCTIRGKRKLLMIVSQILLLFCLCLICLWVLYKFDIFNIIPKHVSFIEQYKKILDVKSKHCKTKARRIFIKGPAPLIYFIVESFHGRGQVQLKLDQRVGSLYNVETGLYGKWSFAGISYLWC